MGAASSSHCCYSSCDKSEAQQNLFVHRCTSKPTKLVVQEIPKSAFGQNLGFASRESRANRVLRGPGTKSGDLTRWSNTKKFSDTTSTLVGHEYLTVKSPPALAHRQPSPFRMAIYNGPARGGTRGGKDQFNWEDVKEDHQRENYLGHAVMAPVGRWQKRERPEPPACSSMLKTALPFYGPCDHEHILALPAIVLLLH